jgi:hypothetical protein
MRTYHPPHGSFQPHELAVLNQAFEAVWQTIKAHRPLETDEEELRAAVSMKLCEIASTEGITDEAALRSATLRSFAF